MSNQNQDFSGIFREIKQGFREFTAGYTTAVKEGADVAERQIIEAAKDCDQLKDIPAGKLLDAIKKGVQYAGKQMIVSGFDLFEQMKAKARK